MTCTVTEWFFNCVFYIVGCGVPLILIIWTTRRTPNCRAMMLMVFLKMPCIMFAIGMIVGGVFSTYQVFLAGKTAERHYSGISSWEYIRSQAKIDGVYGIAATIAGFVYTLPTLVLWSLVHRRSFKFVFLSPEERGESVDTVVEDGGSAVK